MKTLLIISIILIILSIFIVTIEIMATKYFNKKEWCKILIEKYPFLEFQWGIILIIITGISGILYWMISIINYF